MANEKKDSKIRQFILDLKSYLAIESDYYQIILVEKITKIVSLIIISVLLSGLFLGLFFFLLFGLAYLLVPILGKMITFSIILGLFLMLILLIVVLRKEIVINPVLRLVLKTMDTKTIKNRKEEKRNETNQ